MEQISNWQFDLTKPVYLLHPGNKFWEVTLKGLSVKYKVGKIKIKDSAQTGEEQVEKDYATHHTAKSTVVTKILQKLTKGYYPRDAKQIEKKQKKQEKVESKKQNLSKGKKTFTGQYYQRGNEGMKIELNESKVKITRYDDSGKQRFQIRTLENHESAVQFCLQQQQWAINQGFKPNNKKFIYTFVVDDQPDTKKPKTTSKKNTTSNFLSVTQMTDDAISHRSRNISQTKSDRSAGDSGVGDNNYVQTKLGPPTSSCIKVLLAETWADQVDPTGWIMSEKLDGVRMFWTGTTMYSRNGNRFFFPKFFTKNWPKSQLDGQLFIGRGRFSETISAIKKNTPIDQQWKKVKYLVFDCPGLKKPFKTRIKYMEEVIKSIDNPYIKCHGHRQCTGFTDLFEELDKVNKIDGEGLMLRNPQSLYQNRRSKNLLKVKTFYDDEATVLGYTAGTGRCTGMVGALKVRNTHGVQFEIGSGLTDADRRKPPKIGSKVTYKYQQFNKDSGKPRFPTYMRKYDSI